MQAQKQIHASQLWQQGLNDVTFSHVIPLYWRLYRYLFIVNFFYWWVRKHETINTKKFSFLIKTLWIWFSPYTEKHGSEKSRILVYFTQWLGRNDRLLLGWLHDFKVYFLLNTNSDSATCKWKYRKIVIKITSS